MSEKNWFKKIKTVYEINPLKFGVEVSARECSDLLDIINDSLGIALSIRYCLMQAGSEGKFRSYSVPGFRITFLNSEQNDIEKTMESIREIITEYIHGTKHIPEPIEKKEQENEVISGPIFKNSKKEISPAVPVINFKNNPRFVDPIINLDDNPEQEYHVLLYTSRRPGITEYKKIRKRFAHLHKESGEVSFQCSKCEKWKHNLYFSKNPNNLAGLKTSCIECGK